MTADFSAFSSSALRAASAASSESLTILAMASSAGRSISAARFLASRCSAQQYIHKPVSIIPSSRYCPRRCVEYLLSPPHSLQVPRYSGNPGSIEVLWSDPVIKVLVYRASVLKWGVPSAKLAQACRWDKFPP